MRRQRSSKESRSRFDDINTPFPCSHRQLVLRAGSYAADHGGRHSILDVLVENTKSTGYPRNSGVPGGLRKLPRAGWVADCSTMSCGVIITNTQA